MPGSISREELKKRMEANEDFILLDVLLPESYAEEHLPGAINIPLFKLDEAAVADLPHDKDIVVYCGSFECGASPAAALKLAEMGFARVFDFEGGLADWKEALYPLESGSPLVAMAEGKEL